MKLNVITLNTVFSAALALLLFAPLSSIAGSDFDKVVKEATAEIAKAKAANNEWRDSKAILDKAIAAEKAGDHATAMKLANQAKQQGIMAIAQAKQQKNAGPH